MTQFETQSAVTPMSPRQFSRMAAFCFLIVLAGCHPNLKPKHQTVLVPSTQFSSEGISAASYIESVDAKARPPAGWKPDPLKSSNDHAHQVWISPTGHTAYGIIRFNLPLPIGHDWALWGFLQNMKKSEGEADLLAKQWDENLQGLRFVAEGGMYLIRANLFVRGTTGWAVYAGTLRKEKIEIDELKLAEQAREFTICGSGSDNHATAGNGTK
jgi:hypothetical protein